MKNKDVKTLIDSVDVPAAYWQFPKDTGQKPPFICYFYTGSNDVLADDSNYKHINSLAIELYTNEKDFELENKLETALNDAGLVWSREDTYIDSEKLFEAIYYTDVIIDDVSNIDDDQIDTDENPITNEGV